MNRATFFLEWSKLHGDAKTIGIVRAWLSVSYILAKPFVVLRISPNTLSYSTIGLGILYVLYIESNFAILFLLLTLFFDGIDGSVALISNKVSKFGALLDSLADRVVEALWILGLFLLGAPWQPLILIWVGIYLQEYMRARSSSIGITDILIITWCERPVRASLIFIFLIARAIGFSEDIFLSVVTYAWMVLQLSSAFKLFLVLRSNLQQSQR